MPNALRRIFLVIGLAGWLALGAASWRESEHEGVFDHMITWFLWCCVCAMLVYEIAQAPREKEQLGSLASNIDRWNKQRRLLRRTQKDHRDTQP